MVIVQKPALLERIALSSAGFIIFCGIVIFCILAAICVFAIVLPLKVWNRLTKRLETCSLCRAKINLGCRCKPIPSCEL